MTEYVIDLLLTNGNDKFPNVVDGRGWKFVIGWPKAREKVNKKIFYRSAFTLMELMIVVVAVGVIAAFAIPNYQKAVERSYERDAINNLTLLHSVENAYKARYGNYYPSITGSGSNVGIAVLNPTFQLNLIGTNFNYQCGENAGSGTFACYASRVGGPTAYTIKVKNTNAIDSPNYPCCYLSASCYISLPTAGC